MHLIPAFVDLSPEELLELLHLLCDFGLIDSHKDKGLESRALTLHPLVRETNLHHLKEQEVEDYAHALLRVLEASLETSGPLSQCNKLRWLATALHGKAPMALIMKNSNPPKANALLARASLFEYVTLLFLEIQSILKTDMSW
jgi:hypothetical protein